MNQIKEIAKSIYNALKMRRNDEDIEDELNWFIKTEYNNIFN